MGKRRPKPVEPPQLRETLHGTRPDASVDLHGMTAHQAQLRVEQLLTTWSSRQPGAVLRVTTGKGNRSPGAPVLLGVVEEILRHEMGHRIDDMTLDAGGGGWLVRIRR